ncbi:MAG: hypothetical protein ABH863_06320 [Candidatus Micrarchaeota archaeon]
MREDRLARIQERLDSLERGAREIRSTIMMTFFLVAVLFALAVGAILKLFFG